MRLFTKTGDDGTTGRPGGGRIGKDDPRVSALGAIDELNTHLGLCLQCGAADARLREALEPVQRELLAAGALLAAAGTDARPNVRLDDAAVARMEGQISDIEGRLPKLEHFIVPGGGEAACRLHVGRAVCRRAERAAVAARNAADDVPSVVLRYLNRLSDLLFVLARAANADAGIEDTPWHADA